MWLIYIVVGIVAAAFVWLVERFVRRAQLPAYVIVAAAIAVAGFYLLRGPQTLGAKSWFHETPGREITLFAVMLVGMAIRYVTKAIEDRREVIAAWKKEGAVGKKPGLEFDKWEFAYPLLVSAITFGGLLSQIKESELTLQAVLMSFQTGFFWQTLLAAKAKAA